MLVLEVLGQHVLEDRPTYGDTHTETDAACEAATGSGVYEILGHGICLRRPDMRDKEDTELKLSLSEGRDTLK